MTEHITPTFSWEKNPNDVRRNLVREMNRIGAVRIDGRYSGGHDEGGLESLEVFDKNDERIEGVDSYDHVLWQAVEDLLSTKFYSWALECSVWGHVYVDLKKRRAWTEGEEEVTEYQADTDPIDMRW